MEPGGSLPLLWFFFFFLFVFKTITRLTKSKQEIKIGTTKNQNSAIINYPIQYAMFCNEMFWRMNKKISTLKEKEGEEDKWNETHTNT